jgi:membrane protein DedA with SNARE-associated domain
MNSGLTFLLSALLLYKYWALFIAFILAAIIIPIPVNTLLLASGAFASQGYMSFSISLIVVVIGNVIGDCIDYLLARIYGRSILHKMRIRVPSYIERLERFVGKYPGSTIFITRFVGTIEPLTSLLCGFIGIGFVIFIVYDILGNIVSNGLVLYAGYILGSYWQDFTGILNITNYILMAVIILIVILALIWQKNKKSAKSMV